MSTHTGCGQLTGGLPICKFVCVAVLLIVGVMPLVTGKTRVSDMLTLYLNNYEILQSGFELANWSQSVKKEPHPYNIHRSTFYLHLPVVKHRYEETHPCLDNI